MRWYLQLLLTSGESKTILKAHDVIWDGTLRMREGVGEEVNYRDAAYKIVILGLSCELYLTWKKRVGRLMGITLCKRRFATP